MGQAHMSRRDRRRLLKQVRTMWTQGVLEHSLHQAALVALDVQEQPDALAHPWHLESQEANQPPQALPAGTSIVQVYEEAGGELLILGEPGAGKTTLLLEIARTLLERAEADEHQPVPVVLHLSSWALPPRVNIRQAVSIQPLTEDQLEEYMHSTKGQLEGLRQAMQQEREMSELAHRPLMLSIMTLAYQGVGAEALPTASTREACQQQVIASYVERMLSGRGLSTPAPGEHLLRWVRSLATQMQQRPQTVFFLEQLQPDWLADRRRRLLYQRVVGLLGGLAGGLLFGLLGLLDGLGVFLQHFALRFSLWGAGALPWNVVAFLDEAAERLLLRKVGGGYIFVHRLLLEYFAALEKKES